MYFGVEECKLVSTLGKGLIAKPTVDILLEVDTESNIEKIKDTLIHNSWLLMAYENKTCVEIAFNKGYTNAKSEFILKYI